MHVFADLVFDLLAASYRIIGRPDLEFAEAHQTVRDLLINLLAAAGFDDTASGPGGELRFIRRHPGFTEEVQLVSLEVNIIAPNVLQLGRPGEEQPANGKAHDYDGAQQLRPEQISDESR